MTPDVVFQGLLFAVGVGFLSFSCAVIWKKDSSAAKISALLVFPVALLLTSLFAPRVTSLGIAGLSISLEDKKAAAKKVLESDPDLVLSISNQKGPEGLRKAVDLIDGAKTDAQLKTILPYETHNNRVYFIGYNRGKYGKGRYGSPTIYPVAFDGSAPKPETPIVPKPADGMEP